MDPYFIYVITDDKPKLLWAANEAWASRTAKAEVVLGNEVYVYKLETVHKPKERKP